MENNLLSKNSKRKKINKYPWINLSDSVSYKIIPKIKIINIIFLITNLNKIKGNTPGVYTYNFESDWNLKSNAVIVNTFEEKKFWEENNYNNYYPCIGHYDAYNLRYDLRYESLYNCKIILFNYNIKKFKIKVLYIILKI